MEESQAAESRLAAPPISGERKAGRRLRTTAFVIVAAVAGGMAAHRCDLKHMAKQPCAPCVTQVTDSSEVGSLRDKLKQETARADSAETALRQSDERIEASLNKLGCAVHRVYHGSAKPKVDIAAVVGAAAEKGAEKGVQEGFAGADINVKVNARRYNEVVVSSHPKDVSPPPALQGPTH